jgi:hypothetical protein
MNQGLVITLTFLDADHWLACNYEPREKFIMRCLGNFKQGKWDGGDSSLKIIGLIEALMFKVFTCLIISILMYSLFICFDLFNLIYHFYISR